MISISFHKVELREVNLWRVRMKIEQGSSDENG